MMVPEKLRYGRGRRSFIAGTLAFSVLSVSLLSADALAQRDGRGPRGPRAPTATLIKGGTVHLGTGDVLEGGSVLIQGKKIAAVGKDVKAPEGATVVDATGRHVYPGLIDSHSRVLVDPTVYLAGGGILHGNVLDALDRFQPYVVEETLAQGVTAIYVSGSGRGSMEGFGAVLKLTPKGGHRTLKEKAAAGLLFSARGARPSVQLRNLANFEKQLKGAKAYIESWEDYEEKLTEYKDALEKLRKEEEEKKKKEKGGDKKDEKKGEGEKKDEKKEEGDEKKDEKKEKEGDGKRPGRGLRELGPGNGASPAEVWKFLLEQEAQLAAQERRPPRGGPPRGGGKPPSGGDKKKDAGPKKPKKPTVNPTFEVLRQALEGSLVLHVQAHSAVDIQNLLEVVDAYPVRMVLTGASEAHRAAAALKEAGVAVMLHQNATGSAESLAVASKLHDAGVTVVIGSAGTSPSDSRFLALSAAAAVAGGLDPAQALCSITSRAAQLLGVADRIGTLAVGKDADVVISSGPPLSTASRVEKVFVEGEVVFER